MLIATGRTCKEALKPGPDPRDAVTAPFCTLETFDVEIAKLWEVAPAGTATDAGTLAPATLLNSQTANPPDGAGCVSATVPVTCAHPPATDDAERAMPLRAGGVGGWAIVMVTVCETERLPA